MAKSERYYSFSLPEGSDPVAGSLGIAQLNTFYDNVDYTMNALQGYITTGARPDFFIGKWVSSGASGSATSGGAMIDATATWTEKYTQGTVGAVTFDLATGKMTFSQEGIYNIFLTLSFPTDTAVTSGWLKTGLTKFGTGTFLPRLYGMDSLETKQGTQKLHQFYSLWSYGVAGADVLTSDVLNIGLQQANNLASTLTLGTSSYIQIEYVRHT